jgi:tetratricopeptide (TPR) repeat protein
MSVLLEALKKAANEKKRTDPAVSQHKPEAEKAHTPHPSREAMNQTLARDTKTAKSDSSPRNHSENLSSEEAVRQSDVADSVATFESASTDLSRETAVETNPEPAKEPAPQSDSGPADSPEVTEGALTLRSEDVASASPLSEATEAAEPGSSQGSSEQAGSKGVEGEDAVESAPAASEKAILTLREQDDSASSNNGDSQELDLETRLALASDDAPSFESERSAFPETTELEPESEPSSEFHDGSLDENRTPRSDKPLTQKSSQTAEVDGADKIDMAAADSSHSQASGRGEKTGGADAQNDWSLSKIPGYANDETPRKPVSEKKSRQWLQVMQSGQRQPSRRYRWLLGLLITLLVATSLFVFGFIYFYQSQVQLDQSLARYQLPLPEASSPVDKPASVALADEVVGASPDSAAGSAGQASETPQEQAAEPSSELSEANGASETADQNDEAAPTMAEAKPSELQEMETPSALTAEQSYQAPKSPSATEEDKGNARQPQRLSIRSDGASKTLQSAYAAYQRGQWQEAKSHYQTLLRQEPENLAAMMGIAAVNVKEQAYSKAMQRYQTILRLHPGNENALAAQAALAGVFAQDPENIRQLKNWVQKWPNQPQLQAALGRYHAQNRDWLQAQSHFFKAFELVPKKADYAHNLAVSLDQLGKYRLARDHYRKALSLSESALSASQQASIRARIDVLNQFLSEES